ncbi:LOW QUALITY PROTEIN: hypothetical protein E2986_13139 [Frieseomelitta varia]|uniref:Galectin n=1 Tax=Frieseomelitta varia TaxID=561572 RepID=A0A833RP08_9HYME|nr:LOW QUALITY PROTEIN: hypothetical protein E2986_13139 [Frieseomelitta varia]
MCIYNIFALFICENYNFTIIKNKHYSITFSVNLLCKIAGNIALHFNARLDRGYVVRNSKFKGCWEEEETCSPVGHTAFRRNSYVHILIFCTANEYQVAVNGEHFCAFAYRMPLEDVMCLEINGSLEDVRFKQFELFVYPDPKLCRPSNILSLKIDRPLVEFLVGIFQIISLSILFIQRFIIIKYLMLQLRRKKEMRNNLFLYLTTGFM